ncbi:MAG: hypothetical protein GIW94_14140 [Candidatus Eremiobacteraeota bacterium]|nr:hypothetical protein [Candidatus Eremiobacteraeota bacterium]
MLTHMLAVLFVAALAAASPFGGPAYTGRPDLPTTSALTFVGGGAKVFSTRRAFNAIIGIQLLDPEIQTLEKRYGSSAVASWMHISDFTVKDALQHAARGGIRLPTPPGPLVGKRLFTALVHDGTGHDGAFWTGFWLDRLFSHAVTLQVMHDVDAHFGHGADALYHRINNRAMYDLDNQVGDSVGLAAFH